MPAADVQSLLPGAGPGTVKPAKDHSPGSCAFVAPGQQDVLNVQVAKLPSHDAVQAQLSKLRQSAGARELEIGGETGLDVSAVEQANGYAVHQETVAVGHGSWFVMLLYGARSRAADRDAAVALVGHVVSQLP